MGAGVSRRSTSQSGYRSTMRLTSAQGHGRGFSSSPRRHSYVRRNQRLPALVAPPPSHSPAPARLPSGAPLENQKIPDTAHVWYFLNFFFTRQRAPKPDCPVESQTPGNPACHHRPRQS